MSNNAYEVKELYRMSKWIPSEGLVIDDIENIDSSEVEKYHEVYWMLDYQLEEVNSKY